LCGNVFVSPQIPLKTQVSVLPSGSVLEGCFVTLTGSSDANPAMLNYTWSRQIGRELNSCRLDTLLPWTGPTWHREAGTTVKLRTKTATKGHQWCWTLCVSNKRIERNFQPIIQMYSIINYVFYGT